MTGRDGFAENVVFQRLNGYPRAILRDKAEGLAFIVPRYDPRNGRRDFSWLNGAPRVLGFIFSKRE